jgi:hypothetical protein
MGEPIVIPTDPGEFFEGFFPSQFANDRERYPREDSPGSALFEVIGVGSWGVKIAAGGLVVERGRPDDTLLQIAVGSEDFTAIFVERTQREVDSSGTLSDDSRDVFKPLFVSAEKAAVIAGTVGNTLATLAFDLDHEGRRRQMFITPGPFERTEPKATIAMKLEDFLAMHSGRKNPVMLFMSGKLAIQGDIGHAIRMQVFLK